MIRKLGVERQVLEARWAKQDYLCKTKNLHAPSGDAGRSGSPGSQPRPLVSERSSRDDPYDGSLGS